MRAPPPPTIEQIAAAIGSTPEYVREMGQRYRRWCEMGRWSTDEERPTQVEVEAERLNEPDDE